MISTPAPFGVWPPQGPALSQPPLESPGPAGPLIPVISTLWTTFTVEGLPVASSPGRQQLPLPQAQAQTSSQMWSGWRQRHTHTSEPNSAQTLHRLLQPAQRGCELLPLKMPVWPGGTAGDQNARHTDSLFQAQDIEYSAFGPWESRMLLPGRDVCPRCPNLPPSMVMATGTWDPLCPSPTLGLCCPNPLGIMTSSMSPLQMTTLAGLIGYAVAGEWGLCWESHCSECLFPCGQTLFCTHLTDGVSEV